jgi:uncharacterized protein (TIGR00255 family)
MTGFGSGTCEGVGLAVRVELRSVNHRHLTIQLRMPPGLASLESEVEGRIRKRLSRGAVGVAMTVTPLAGSESRLIDHDLAGRLLVELKTLAEESQLVAPDVRSVLSLPGVLVNGEAPAPEDVGAPLLGALDLALEEILAARSQEGASLLADLEANLAQTEEFAAQAAILMPEVQVRHQAALIERVGILLGDAQAVSQQDLAREVAVLADRLDVAEELSRLDAHVAHFRSKLALGEPVGRSLDFLSQELLREANTLGSKCNDAEIAHLVVDLKAVIERLREQVQNVE